MQISKTEKLVEVELAYMLQQMPKLKFVGVEKQLLIAEKVGIISLAEGRAYRYGERFESLVRLHKKRQEWKKAKPVKVAKASA